MSVRASNAWQLAIAAAAGALAVSLGLASVEQDRRVAETRKSLEMSASLLSERLNADLRMVAGQIEFASRSGALSDARVRQGVVERWKATSPSYAEIVLAGPNGRVLAASQSRFVGRDEASELWFDRGRQALTLIDLASRPSAGQTGDVSLSAPVKGASGELEGVLSIHLGESWFQEAERSVQLSLGAAAPYGYTVIGGGGRVLYQSASDALAGTDTRVLEGSVQAGRSDGIASGWVVSARSLPIVNTEWSIPPITALAALAAILGAAAIGWWIGARFTRSLKRVGRVMNGEMPPGPSSALPELRDLERHAEAARDHQGQLVRTANDLRSALSRTRERLQAFEKLSGWTYWSIDVASGQATWAGKGAGGAILDRTLPLEIVTQDIAPKDHDLLALTLDTARESEGPHDIELDMGTGAQRKRLLVRLDRAGDADEPADRLHALTRELEATPSRADESALGLSPAFAAVERRNNSTLRPVIESILHDFNNVLTLVMMNLDALRGTGTTEEMRRVYVDRAMQGAERGAGLTHRLVAFARRQTTSLHRADLAATLDGLKPFLAASLPEGYDLRTDFAPGLPPVMCSERQLELVLMNLIIAVHAPASRNARILVRGTTETTDGRPFVRLVITCEAAGSSVAASQVENRLVGQAELGMEAVRVLALQLGGTLDDGDSGQPGSLVLRLPAGEVSQPRRATALPAVQDPARILLVDSDALMRATLQDALLGLGHVVRVAHSGADALKRLESDPYDVLVVEQGLPIMTGLQLAAAAARMRPGLRIIIMAAREQLPRSATQFLALDKPFGQIELASTLLAPTNDSEVRANAA